MNENEAGLLERFSTGDDAEAFAELVQRYVQMVYSTSWRVLKDDDDATDVTQETFFELTRHASRITGSLGCWLHKVATQKSIDLIRRSVHRRQRERAYARTRPVEVQSWQDLSGHVDLALDALDESLRSFLLDRFMEGKTTSQIAKERGISQATVSRRVNAGLDRLRSTLRRKGLLVTAGALGAMLAENTARAVTAEALGGLGKMAMVGTTRSAAATVTKVGAIKVCMALVAAVMTFSTAAYVRHTRSARPLSDLSTPVATSVLASTGADSPSAGTDGSVNLPGPDGRGNERGDVPKTHASEPDQDIETSDVLAVATSSGPAGVSGHRSGPSPARVLRFPYDEPVGVVYVQDEGLAIPETTQGFHPGYAYAGLEQLSCARGDVHIPAGMRVTLSIEGTRATPERYLKVVGRLDPNDLYGLRFFNPVPITLPDELIEPIARLSGLRCVGVAGMHVSPKALSFLAKLPHIEELQTPVGLTDEGMAEIAKMKSLKRLHVVRDQLTDEGLKMIAGLTSLESLELYGNSTMTDSGLEFLVTLPALTHLRLGMAGAFTDRCLETVAAMPSLKALWLGAPYVTDRGLLWLSKSRSLERLCMNGSSGVTGWGLVHLSAMPQLKALDLRSAQLTEADVDDLVAMQSLEDLRLPPCVSDAGITKLSALDRLKSLYVTASSGSPLTDASLAAIAELHDLEELCVSGGRFTPQGIERLACLDHLETLTLGSSGLCDDSLKALNGLSNLRDLTLMCDGELTLSDLNALNSLSDLESLSVCDVNPDERPWDLSGLKNLRRLSINVRHDPTKADGAYRLGSNVLDPGNLAWLSGLTRLETFSLHGVGMDDAGFAYLAPLTDLKHLYVTGSPDLTDEALGYLAHMHRLDSLTIWSSQITTSGIGHLCSLETLHSVHICSAGRLSGQAVVHLRMELPLLQSLYLGPSEQTHWWARRVPPFSSRVRRRRAVNLSSP